MSLLSYSLYQVMFGSCRHKMCCGPSYLSFFLDDASLLRCLFMVQFDEQKDQVIVERVLRVIFLDADRPSAVSFLTSFFHPQHIYIVKF